MSAAAEKPLICLGEALVDLICPDPVADRSEATRLRGPLRRSARQRRRRGRARRRAGGPGERLRGRRPRALPPLPAGRDRRRPALLRRRRRCADAVRVRLSRPRPRAGLRDPRHRDRRRDRVAGGSRGGDRRCRRARSSSARTRSSTSAAARSRRPSATGRATAGVPLLFDPNLRPGRWADTAAARERCLPYVAAADVLKCNLGEARWLLDDGEVAAAADAAEALAELGPALVVVTAGTAPAAARGACAADVAPPEVELVSPLGAGDAFMGTLAAGLHAGGFDLAGCGEALAAAAEQGALACTHLGAFPSMSGGGERGYARGAGRTTGPDGEVDLDRRPRFPVPKGWKRPSRKRVRAIRDRLRELYGSRRNDPHGDPVHELVLTILSQNTNDNNRDVAYRRLRDRLGDWDAIRDAPTEEVVEAIRPGGLANIKGPRIQQVLRRARARGRPRLAPRRAPPGGGRLPDVAAGRRPQDGGLRDDLRPRPARGTGRHPRPPGRRQARPVPARRSRSRAPTTRCWRSPTATTRTSST